MKQKEFIVTHKTATEAFRVWQRDYKKYPPLKVLKRNLASWRASYFLQILSMVINKKKNTAQKKGGTK